MAAGKFPQVVKRGSVSVKIYRTPSRGYDAFTISYYQDGARKRLSYGSLAEARAEAEVVACRLGNSDADVLTLRSADRAAYLRAMELLGPLRIRLETGAAELAEAKTALGDVPLMRAVQYYLARNPRGRTPITVAAVVKELLSAKKADGVSQGYLNHLRYDLEKFSKAFCTDINSIYGPDIDSWLRGLKVSPRTRNNLRTSVQTLINFAKARKHLPKDHDELDSVSIARDSDGAIEIFKPSEFAEVLQHAKDDLIPFLVLSGFAGVRHAEIQRLTWDDINFEASLVEIKATKAKTASRRMIPILPNLHTWLLPYAQTSGKVCSYSNVADEIADLVRAINHARRATWAATNKIGGAELKKADADAKKRLSELRKRGRLKRGERSPGAETAHDEGWAPFAWKRNGLRHSFISYRVAQLQDMAQVALEAGNSPQIIFRHYRELVRPVDAFKWFSLVPPKNETNSTGVAA